MRLVILAALSLLGSAAVAAESEPVLVELFTSQSCSSCPPAEAILRDLAARDDVVAIEWHVDYWNDLVHGRDGRWKDPFSHADFTARQRAYNVALRGRTGVYTPQAVIDGRFETVGSRKGDIERLIREAHAARTDGEGLRLARDGAAFVVTAGDEPLDARFVVFLRRATTRVGGGENRALDLAEAHVAVSTVVHRGVGAGARLAPPKLGDGEGCALLLEDPASGAARAAAYC